MEYVDPSTNQVTITCKEYDKMLAKGILQLLKEEYFVDVSVAYSDVSYKVHRLILAVFLPTLKDHMNEISSGVDGSSNSLQILNLDYVASATEDVRALIEFVYSGKATMSKERLEHFGRLACDLNVESAMKAVEEYRQTEEDLAKRNDIKEPKDESISEGDKGTNNENTSESITPKQVLEKTQLASRTNARNFHSTIPARSTTSQIKSAENKQPRKRQVKPSRMRTKERDVGSEEDASDFEQDEVASDESDLMPPVHRQKTESANQRSALPKKRLQQSNKIGINELCHRVFKSLEKARAIQMKDKASTDDDDDDDIRITGKLCNLCGHRSETPSKHRTHLQKVHGKGRAAEKDKVMYKCSQCDFVSKYNAGVHKHFTRKHTNNRKHHCPECDYSAFYRNEIVNHISRFHRKEQKHMCEICGSRYQMKGALNHHILIKHKGLRPFKCELCDKDYVDKHHLNIHIKTKHTADAEREVCTICGNTYSKRSGLQQHMKHAHGTSLKPLRKPHIPRQSEAPNREADLCTEEASSATLSLETLF